LSTHGFINSYLEELKALAKPQSATPVCSPSARQARWIPPPHPVPKINVDAAVSKTEDRGVVAAFCRDNNGMYLGASAAVFSGITDPTILKALAAREALALAEDLSLNQLYIVSDCKSAISDIKDGSMGKDGSNISEIRTHITRFHGCAFSHKSRASNFEAHSLARHMISSGIGCHMWLDISNIMVD
jgi:hypothetical protein